MPGNERANRKLMSAMLKNKGFRAGRNLLQGWEPGSLLPDCAQSPCRCTFTSNKDRAKEKPSSCVLSPTPGQRLPEAFPPPPREQLLKPDGERPSHVKQLPTPPQLHRADVHACTRANTHRIVRTCTHKNTGTHNTQICTCTQTHRCVHTQKHTCIGTNTGVCTPAQTETQTHTSYTDMSTHTQGHMHRHTDMYMQAHTVIP